MRSQAFKPIRRFTPTTSSAVMVAGLLSSIVAFTGPTGPTVLAFQDSGGAATREKTTTTTKIKQNTKPITTRAPQPVRRPKPASRIPSHDPKNEIALGDGLTYVDTSVGTGDVLQSGDVAIVQYAGWIKESGDLFSTNRRGNEKRFVTHIPGRLIEGWNRGLLGMREGGRRLLFVPAQLGYGEKGYADINVPPNADLVFEVELKGLLRKPEIELASAKKWDDGSLVVDLVEGHGPAFDRNGYATFHVTWWNNDGQLEGSSLEREKPVLMPFDNLATWSLYTPGMKSGGKRAVAANVTKQEGFGENAKTVTAHRTYLIQAIEVSDPLTPPEYDESKIVEADDGLKYVDLKIGEGKKFPKYSLPDINFIGWREDRSVYDTTLSPGGESRVVSPEFDLPVWGKGLIGMHVGGSRLIWVPAALAYGTEGNGQLRIRPDEDLLLYVELVDFEMPLFLPPDASEDAEFMKEWNEAFGNGGDSNIFEDIDEENSDSGDGGGK